MRRENFPSYEERFCRFSQSIEKWLIIVVMILIISLVLSQTFLHIDALRVWLVEVEKLEGVAS